MPFASRFVAPRPHLRARAAAIVITAAAVTGGAACSRGRPDGTKITPVSTGPTTTLAGANPNVTGTINVTDQTSDGTTFHVASVSIDGAPAGGWVVFHVDDHGKVGPSVGAVHIAAGASSDVRGRFDTTQTNGTRLWAALHADDHAAGVFEYGTRDGADLPVRSGRDLVMQHITLQVR